uniref:Plant heme peroxidase family profile domain-containing protein n=1 Tax=Oryza punctata TaxID=4537 RepID=A0A0E0JIZ7_ORYPU
MVSYADILAIDARDVVAMRRRQAAWPDMRVKDLAAMFANNNLTALNMVALSGVHTDGFAHCTRFADRLYGCGCGCDGGVDPSYDPAYVWQLMAACLRDVAPTITINMDLITPATFDNAYYANGQPRQRPAKWSSVVAIAEHPIAVTGTLLAASDASELLLPPASALAELTNRTASSPWIEPILASMDLIQFGPKILYPKPNQTKPYPHPVQTAPTH